MKRFSLLAVCVIAALGFSALGIWQLERLAWKRDLIGRVESRVGAAPVPLPGAAEWPRVNARDHEYRRVRLTGVFRHDRVTLVDALTERGPGFWVLTPLAAEQGTVLVNRGFVPADRRNDYARPEGPVALTGLLRLPEPGGRFLRPNRPDADLWYSRDVAAIAAARGLGSVAPFFVDAERGSRDAYPIGGLTVVRFRNAHLGYALTWLALAGMALFGAWRLLFDRTERRR